jgi:hypothetical protein
MHDNSSVSYDWLICDVCIVVATTTADIILAEDVVASVEGAALSVMSPQSWITAGWAVGGALTRWANIRARVVALGFAPQLAYIAREAAAWQDYMWPSVPEAAAVASGVLSEGPSAAAKEAHAQ